MADTDKTTKNDSAPTNQVFRQKTLDRISSPEQLTDYLKVTSPGVWIVLVTAILLLAGLIVWATIGDLETTEKANIVVTNNMGSITSDTPDHYKEGMTVRVNSKEYTISLIDVTEYGFSYACFDTDLPDGEYRAEVVTEVIHPIDFLLK